MQSESLQGTDRTHSQQHGNKESVDVEEAAVELKRSLKRGLKQFPPVSRQCDVIFVGMYKYTFPIFFSPRSITDVNSRLTGIRLPSSAVGFWAGVYPGPSQSSGNLIFCTSRGGTKTSTSSCAREALASSLCIPNLSNASVIGKDSVAPLLPGSVNVIDTY